MRIVLLLVFMSVFSTVLQAQGSRYNTGNGLLPSFSYGYQIPAGDLSERFGTNFNLGLSLDYITAKSSWFFGLDFGYLFGSEVKTDVLANLRTSDGFVISNNRVYADLQLRERGWYIGGQIGKIIPLSDNNPRSGLKVSVGAGLLQHRIRIQQDPLNYVPQVDGEYQKGYDRLTNGLALKEFIGYQVLSNNKRVNFYFGIDMVQGFTKNRRSFNFDTQSVEDANRLDLIFGIRAGWIVPIYLGGEQGDIYY